MAISTVQILKYVQQCYVKWFWTICSLGAPGDLGRPFHIRAAVLANRSLSFSLVSEQRKTDEGHFRISQREKWNESHPLPALSLAQFLARSLTLVPRCLLRNQTETLATQASFSFPLKSMVWCHQEVILWKTNGPVVQVPCTSWNRLD